MAEIAGLKRDRVHLRLGAKAKCKLERAAAYEETTVSRFVLANALAAAERVIEAREKVVLSPADWDAFHEACSIRRNRTRPREKPPDAVAGASVDEPALVIEPLGSRHDRADFSCGEPALDACLRQRASQDARRRMARIFVAVGDAPGSVAGYYSPGAASFEKDELPPGLAKRLPHYPVPTAVIGRLAVDLRHRGRGLGEALLLDAIHRIARASATIAVYAVVVVAKNDRARAFYERHGFKAFVSAPRRPFLPLGTFLKLRGEPRGTPNPNRGHERSTGASGRLRRIGALALADLGDGERV